MKKREKEPQGAVSYGWCMTGDHDTHKGRGGCPVQVGIQRPCGCSCHNGATEPRSLLSSKPLAPAAERIEDSPAEGQEAEPVEALVPEVVGLEPVGVGVGEQIPLL